VLDSLYIASTNTQALGTVMTYYHGIQNAPFVFSGFPLWWFSKGDAQLLSRFVLTNIFGVPYNGTAPARMKPVANDVRLTPAPATNPAGVGSAGALQRVVRQRAPAPVSPSSIRKPQE